MTTGHGHCRQIDAAHLGWREVGSARWPVSATVCVEQGHDGRERWVLSWGVVRGVADGWTVCSSRADALDRLNALALEALDGELPPE